MLIPHCQLATSIQPMHCTAMGLLQPAREVWGTVTAVARSTPLIQQGVNGRCPYCSIHATCAASRVWCAYLCCWSTGALNGRLGRRAGAAD
jgi:hypothetical protein